MNWNQVWTVFGKELRDSLRDRRTVFSMLVFPVVVMPGLMFGFASFSMKAVKKAQEEVPAIMVLGAENSPTLATALSANKKLKIVPPAQDYADQVSNKKIRAAVEIPAGFDHALGTGIAAKVKIYIYGSEMKSGFAADEIDRTLRDHRKGFVIDQLTKHGLPETLVSPYEVERKNVAPPEKVGGNLFGGIVPYVLIVLSFVGAMYPAIDLAAGEKERGTMETILCSPVGRLELVLGKFFTILTTSLVTVVTSIIAMGVTGAGLASMMGKAAASGAKAAPALTVHPLGMLGVVAMVIPLAAAFAAIQFAVALFAKSHKEAQTYLSPFMVVMFIPAMAAMLPGVELNAKLAFIPILNVSLISKEMISGVFPAGMMALIFLSSCLYAALALAFAVRIFNRESVIFRG